MLPDGDALDIVLALNKLPERPAIIMLTAKDAKEDVIDGLNKAPRFQVQMRHQGPARQLQRSPVAVPPLR
jgi:CheY-like chemotaxis protein